MDLFDGDDDGDEDVGGTGGGAQYDALEMVWWSLLDRNTLVVVPNSVSLSSSFIE